MTLSDLSPTTPGFRLDPRTGPEVLIFGPQYLALDQSSAQVLRSQLLGCKRLSWVVDALRNLSSHWEEIRLALPSVGVLDGQRLLDDLAEWLRTGNHAILSFPLPNFLLGPLVVVLHLIQYQQLIESSAGPWEDCLPAISETLGLCVGHLSAAAVSCSEKYIHLEHYGAVAIRLSMLIGALVDAEDASRNIGDRVKSYSVSWDLNNDISTLEKILAIFPQTYISVIQDQRRLTVTLPEHDAEQVLDKIKTSGFNLVEIQLRGCFHWDGFREKVDSAIKFCDSHPSFRFLESADLKTPSRSSATGAYFGPGSLHGHMLSTILVEKSNWKKSFTEVLKSCEENGGNGKITSIGPDSFVPAFVACSPHVKQTNRLPARPWQPQIRPETPHVDSAGECIAVIGMACQIPGAADMSEFWSLLSAGESQHTEVPVSRFTFDTPWRDANNDRKWYGNFLKDHDMFDDRFFGKSPRESASTDPQHRLMLQVAYQAVEQSGYLSASNIRDDSIGCYIGLGISDYERNVACHPVTAYTAVGNLRAFVAGKISHYFGWTGPALTIDTACSSSAVAIHSACKAILSGDCRGALAGGVNVMTSPEWFQSLGGASFLSPSGQCRPFDARGDGYCRGEAVGAVFLKRLSSAIADGNPIFGVIAAGAVQQNRNTTGITIPNAPSLSGLFEDVIHRSHISPKEISYVEAHGTGTPVGDPVEYDSIRRVLGGDRGCGNLSVGSVKGLIGHSETASGVVALLKVLLMMHHQSIPPQASFGSLRADMNARASDKMTIHTERTSWRNEFKAALINNYGASGSNAALLVTQPPSRVVASESEALPLAERRYPISIFALDEDGLQRYAARLLSFLQSNAMQSLADVASQLARQSNWSLPRSMIFSSSSIAEMTEVLKAPDRVTNTMSRNGGTVSRPLILCFGGQVSRQIGLDRRFYEDVKIFRKHLDLCNETCGLLGASIYPAVFQKAPLHDLVTLQLALFSLQYSCAMSWIDCGANVSAVIGHSFGELTALCISGMLSLSDAAELVARRAGLIRDRWGPDSGRMVAVEGDQRLVEELLAEAHRSCKDEAAATIACFNATRSFTIAGSTKSIEAVLKLASKSSAFSSIDMKPLDVTNAFHCSLVNTISDELRVLTRGFTFEDARIPMEFATQLESNGRPSSDFVERHLRRPVHFREAVRRLSMKFPAAIWLEAGSNSTITKMACRAIAPSPGHHFQSVNITTDNSFQNLTEVTVGLWRQGLSLQYWPFHKAQAGDYRPVLLPPYQFKKSRHWMELTRPRNEKEGSCHSQQRSEPKGMWSVVPGGNPRGNSFTFKVETDSRKYKEIVGCHVLMKDYPTCPSALQLDIVIDGLMSLRPEYSNGTMQPRLLGMQIRAPLPLSSSRTVWFDAEATEAGGHVWIWKMHSDEESNGDASKVLHVSGTVAFYAISDQDSCAEFAGYERLVRKSRCQTLLSSWDVDEIMQGHSIYRSFSDIFSYRNELSRITKLVGKGDESAGIIRTTYTGDTWLDYALADNFCQVAGIYVNTVGKKREDELFICNKIDQWFRSPSTKYGSSKPDVWEVYCCHHQPSENEFCSDIFVFDTAEESLLEVIIGVHFQKVTKAGLSMALTNITGRDGKKALNPNVPVANAARTIPETYHQRVDSHMPPSAEPEPKPQSAVGGSLDDTTQRLREVIANLSGIDSNQIREASNLADLGVDSLMGMELSREIQSVFNCTVDSSGFQLLVDFRDLVKFVKKSLGVEGDGQEISREDAELLVAEVTETESSGTGRTTPADSPTTASSTGLLPVQSNMAELNGRCIRNAFSKYKGLTDDYILAEGMGGYVDSVLPKLDALSITYICDAFEQLDSSFRFAEPGTKLEKIPHLPRHEKLVTLLYQLLAEKAELVELHGSRITRTAVPIPSTSAAALLDDLRIEHPGHKHDYDLIGWMGGRLADCLIGKADGLQILFGSAEGKEFASSSYGHSPFHLVWITQLRDILRDLVPRLLTTREPLKILEIGAGTGGTTAVVVPVLAEIGVPIEYTVTDISPSLVTAARRRFRQYDCVQYRVFDLEAQVSSDLLQSQHIVLATNCVHVARSIEDATHNIRCLLRPDGFLVMLEMTQTVAWMDLVFGLLEGWWQFGDGRTHATAPVHTWKDVLLRSGFGHVDWTDGKLPESKIQRLILATATRSTSEWDSTVPSSQSSPTLGPSSGNTTSREAAVDAFVRKFALNITSSPPEEDPPILAANAGDQPSVVLITGATGSLGSHLVQSVAERPDVGTVICLNRPHTLDAATRQRRAFETCGIRLEADCLSKLRVFQADTSKPKLGLTETDHEYIVQRVTHIVHNAWPMSLTRDVASFEPQFQTMRNLLVLARDAQKRRPARRLAFQFVSSVAAAGMHPLHAGSPLVPEEPLPVASAMPSGYADAKVVCERMLDATLGPHRRAFRPSVVRLGQVAGSRGTGYWNPLEHFPFMVKSAQTLRALPDMQGTLSWCPVNDAAASLAALLLSEQATAQIYHVDNPVRQSWPEMIEHLRNALDIPRAHVLPFEEWLLRVRNAPASLRQDNPAVTIADFFESHFIRISCGGLVLDMRKAVTDCETLRTMQPVDGVLVRKYVQSWKEMGFLM